MSPSDEALAEAIHRYILREFLPGEAPAHLTASTPLVSTGILDSIARLRLVGFLQTTYGIVIAPAEVDIDHFETIQSIVELVRAKQPVK
jgi:acyl carrier protein